MCVCACIQNKSESPLIWVLTWLLLRGLSGWLCFLLSDGHAISLCLECGRSLHLYCLDVANTPNLLVLSRSRDYQGGLGFTGENLLKEEWRSP